MQATATTNRFALVPARPPPLPSPAALLLTARRRWRCCTAAPSSAQQWTTAVRMLAHPRRGHGDRVVPCALAHAADKHPEPGSLHTTPAQTHRYHPNRMYGNQNNKDDPGYRT